MPGFGMLSAIPGTGRTRKRSKGRPPTHGASSLNRVLRGIRLDQVDGRSQAGVYLRRTFDDLAEQLGGVEQLAPTQLLLLETVAKRQLLVHCVQEWALAQKALVTEGSNGPTLAPVVMQLATLEDGLVRMFDKIGYVRAAKPVPTLRDYLRAKEAAAQPASSSPEPT